MGLVAATLGTVSETTKLTNEALTMPMMVMLWLGVEIGCQGGSKPLKSLMWDRMEVRYLLLDYKSMPVLYFCSQVLIIIFNSFDMMVVQTSFLLVTILVVACTVQAAPNNCSAQYQIALQHVVNLKKICKEAVYKDCCEVRS